MKTSPGSSVGARARRGPSRVTVALIAIPTVGLVIALTVWAYQVRDWTWFGLLLAAAVGLTAFVVAPDMFSIASTETPRDWQVMTATANKSNANRPGTSTSSPHSRGGAQNRPDRSA